MTKRDKDIIIFSERGEILSKNGEKMNEDDIWISKGWKILSKEECEKIAKNHTLEGFNINYDTMTEQEAIELNIKMKKSLLGV